MGRKSILPGLVEHVAEVVQPANSGGILAVVWCADVVGVVAVKNPVALQGREGDMDSIVPVDVPGVSGWGAAGGLFFIMKSSSI